MISAREGSLVALASSSAQIGCCASVVALISTTGESPSSDRSISVIGGASVCTRSTFGTRTIIVVPWLKPSLRL